MMDIFNIIAERKIQEAMQEGKFEDLAGKGRPLVFEDETWIPEDLRLAYRLLKNSGYIPPELQLKKEILSLRRLIDTIDDHSERVKKIRELDFKIMRFNMLRKRPLQYEQLPEYTDMITDRLGRLQQ